MVRSSKLSPRKGAISEEGKDTRQIMSIRKITDMDSGGRGARRLKENAGEGREGRMTDGARMGVKVKEAKTAYGSGAGRRGTGDNGWERDTRASRKAGRVRREKEVTIGSGGRVLMHRGGGARGEYLRGRGIGVEAVRERESVWHVGGGRWRPNIAWGQIGRKIRGREEMGINEDREELSKRGGPDGSETVS